ncbi:MAG: hypothetical protein ABIJ45_12945 [Candidatus Zixiibacteriota bacterium]
MKSAKRFEIISIWFAIVSSILLISGCGDDETSGISSPRNQAPTIEGHTMSPYTDSQNYLDWGSQINIGITARDADGDTLTYLWSEDGEGYFISGNTGPIVTWKAPEFSPDGGIYSVTCHVSDGYLTDSLTVSVYIAPHIP